MILGRVPMYDVRSLDEVIDFVESSTGEKVIIGDIDITPAPEARRQAIMGRLGSHLIGLLFRRTAMSGVGASGESW
jgi:hypothetical protein